MPEYTHKNVKNHHIARILCTDFNGDQVAYAHKDPFCEARESFSYLPKERFDTTYKPIPKRVSKWMNVYHCGTGGTGGYLYRDKEEADKAVMNTRTLFLHQLELIYEGDKLVEVKVHDVPTDERS